MSVVAPIVARPVSVRLFAPPVIAPVLIVPAPAFAESDPKTARVNSRYHSIPYAVTWPPRVAAPVTVTLPSLTAPVVVSVWLATNAVLPLLWLPVVVTSPPSVAAPATVFLPAPTAPVVFTLSLHDALPISVVAPIVARPVSVRLFAPPVIAPVLIVPAPAFAE